MSDSGQEELLFNSHTASGMKSGKSGTGIPLNHGTVQALREGNLSGALHQDPGMANRIPLADRMRPRTLDEFIGQEHIVGPGRLLRRAIQKDQLSSLILAGPPGTGKTTLARIIANGTSRTFVTLNAVLAGIADIRSSIDVAKKAKAGNGRGTILFVDEVHRWNKTQQDALLPWVENGTVIFIGATTENPFFEVNKALVSRSRVFLLRSIDESEMIEVARAALADASRGYGLWDIAPEDGVLEFLARMAEGDARNLLNALELAIETSTDNWPPQEGTTIPLTLAAAQESIQKRAVLYDKDGDFHYDAASALIKSIRGSDPDAALYWLARMVYSGEDPRFLFRRMLISAAEDIGLADPDAISHVESCARAFDRIGMPEGQFHLAQAALYLATSPKSNSTLGYFDALKSVETQNAEVPDHLRDASRDAKGFGHGEGYIYPHAFNSHWVAQQYLPDSLRGKIFYEPGVLGIEGERRSAILQRREIQLAALSTSVEPTGSADVSIWSEGSKRISGWHSRAERGTSERLAQLRTTLFDSVKPGRASRILVYDARDGYLAWEARRRSPEGTVVALVRNEEEVRLMEERSAGLGILERPIIISGNSLLSGGAPGNCFLGNKGCKDDEKSSTDAEMESIASCIPVHLTEILKEKAGFCEFDIVITHSMRSATRRPDLLFAALSGFCSFTSGKPVLATGEYLDCEKARLSSIVETASMGKHLSPALLAAFRDFEASFYQKQVSVLPDKHRFLLEFGLMSDDAPHVQIADFSWKRKFERSEIDAWFSPDSRYGSGLMETIGMEGIKILREILLSPFVKVEWPFRIGILQKHASI